MKKILFVDRDGTLIEEPADNQIDSVEKFKLLPDVIPSLLRLRDAGYRLVMVSNQDGLGRESYPQEKFEMVQTLLLQIMTSQGITFDEILICPHRSDDRCLCRKPGIQLVQKYLASPDWDRARSCVIGDRKTDLEFASAMGIVGIRIGPDAGWKSIADSLIARPRVGECTRKTKETSIAVRVNLDSAEPARVASGIGFFDHMLEQIAKHGGFGLVLEAKGDMQIDDHHTVEDVGLALGSALRGALGDKIGIGRFGFSLPMDDASAHVLIDLSGRAYCKFDGSLHRERVGELATEMVPHFFRSLADGLQANIHIAVQGQNTHHCVESSFKAFGRALRAAVARTGEAGVPSTKGSL